ncbi:MAG: hypothetical protein ACQES4_03615 [Bacillota bacterium]
MGAFIVILLVIIAVAVYFLQRSSSGKGKAGTKRKELRQLLNLPPDSADQTIDRYIASLKERHPGHDEEWYLDKVIYDLEKDRR